MLGTNKESIAQEAKLLINKKLNYEFRNISLLLESITHRSISTVNYERLEFLGDAVIQMVITESLIMLHAHDSEGALSREKQILVSKNSLAKMSQQLSLEKLIISKGLNINSNASLKKSIAANIFEAIIGAIFLDSSYDNCKKVINKIFEDLLNNKGIIGQKDPKTMLQEYMQSKNLKLPVYKTIRLDSPAHSPKFKIQCSLELFDEPLEIQSSTVQDGQQEVSEVALNLIKHEK